MENVKRKRNVCNYRKKWRKIKKQRQERRTGRSKPAREKKYSMGT
jgi:hypothetical protein